MNNWMSEPFEYPQEPINRGKVLTAEDVAEKGFARYRDIDGDGVGYRTLPGTDHPQAAFFTRGTGHNDRAVYSEKPEDWIENMDRIVRKFETARTLVPGPVIEDVEGAEIGIIAYGTTEYAVQEARDRLAGSGLAAAGVSVVASGAVLMASDGAWALQLSTLTADEGMAVLQMSRQLYPHDNLGDMYYAGVVEALEDIKERAKLHGEIITYLPTGETGAGDSIELDLLMASSASLAESHNFVARSFRNYRINLFCGAI